MSATAPHPAAPTLGEQMETRRTELHISQSAAARALGVSRSAWVAWASNKYAPEGDNRAKVERFLRWQEGSIDDALQGRLATPVDKPAATSARAVSARQQIIDMTEEQLQELRDLVEAARPGEGDRWLIDAMRLRRQAREANQ